MQESIEKRELKKFLKQAEKLYKEHISEGYYYDSHDFEDCRDGREIHEVLIFIKE
jgi:hypothetical protein